MTECFRDLSIQPGKGTEVMSDIFVGSILFDYVSMVDYSRQMIFLCYILGGRQGESSV